MKKDSGASAVAMSQSIAKLKRAAGVEKEEAAHILLRTVAGREFKLVDGVWSETAIKPDMKVVEIEYGSAAYFALFNAKPEFKPIFLLGEKVAFVANGRVVKIGDTGKAALTDAELAELAK